MRASDGSWIGLLLAALLLSLYSAPHAPKSSLHPRGAGQVTAQGTRVPFYAETAAARTLRTPRRVCICAPMQPHSMAVKSLEFGCAALIYAPQAGRSIDVCDGGAGKLPWPPCSIRDLSAKFLTVYFLPFHLLFALATNLNDSALGCHRRRTGAHLVRQPRSLPCSSFTLDRSTCAPCPPPPLQVSHVQGRMLDV